MASWLKGDEVFIHTGTKSRTQEDTLTINSDTKARKISVLVNQVGCCDFFVRLVKGVRG